MIQRFKDSIIQEFKNSMIQEFNDLKIPELRLINFKLAGKLENRAF
jgi:hypothetical protein